MSGSEIHFLLKALSCTKTPTVMLDYRDYRRRFSITAVPAIKEIYNFDKSKITQVVVDRQKAIDFLKRRHDFLTRPELITTLQEVAEDFKTVIKE